MRSTIPVALDSMLENYEAFLEDTNRRSCKQVICAEGGCNNDHDLLSTFAYTFGKQIMEA